MTVYCSTVCDFKLSRIIEKEIERGGGPAVGSTQNNPLKADLSYLVSNKYTTIICISCTHTYFSITSDESFGDIDLLIEDTILYCKRIPAGSLV